MKPLDRCSRCGTGSYFRDMGGDLTCVNCGHDPNVTYMAPVATFRKVRDLSCIDCKVAPVKKDGAVRCSECNSIEMARRARLSRRGAEPVVVREGWR